MYSKISVLEYKSKTIENHVSLYLLDFIVSGAYLQDAAQYLITNRPRAVHAVPGNLAVIGQFWLTCYSVARDGFLLYHTRAHEQTDGYKHQLRQPLVIHHVVTKVYLEKESDNASSAVTRWGKSVSWLQRNELMGSYRCHFLQNIKSEEMRANK